MFWEKITEPFLRFTDREKGMSVLFECVIQWGVDRNRLSGRYWDTWRNEPSNWVHDPISDLAWKLVAWKTIAAQSPDVSPASVRKITSIDRTKKTRANDQMRWIHSLHRGPIENIDAPIQAGANHNRKKKRYTRFQSEQISFSLKQTTKRMSQSRYQASKQMMKRIVLNNPIFPIDRWHLTDNGQWGDRGLPSTRGIYDDSFIRAPLPGKQILLRAITRRCICCWVLWSFKSRINAFSYRKPNA